MLQFLESLLKFDVKTPEALAMLLILLYFLFFMWLSKKSLLKFSKKC